MDTHSPSSLNQALHESSLSFAKDLVEKLEAGEHSEADLIINELCKTRENDLYQNIGKLTRELHETLNSFHDDADLGALMEEDLPDARKRLDYVVELTEKSVNETLESVETCMPVSDGIGGRAQELHTRWQTLMNKTISMEEFRVLTIELDEYLNDVVEDSKKVHGHLSDILMAQGFQDLTGQVINRVISLVQEVEDSLVSMIRITSQAMDGNVEKKEAANDNSGYGPAVAGIAANDVLGSQDEVDDLLSTLGF